MKIATIGMFDGVHRGHQAVLDELRHHAAALGAHPVVFSFRRHPSAVIRPEAAPALLTDVSLRADLVGRIGGINDFEVLDFDRDNFRATAREFAAKLQNDYGIDALLMGYNNHIGSDHLTASRLSQVLASGFKVYEASPCHGGEYTSTAVRRAVTNADFAAAEQILGHSFTVRGRVVPGKQLGRTIGFPTANIEPLETAQLLPPDGVYAVEITIDGICHPGVANIGTRPTIDDGTARTFEVHIIDFESDIYGKIVDVDIIGRLRPEHRFDSLEALAAQLAVDRARSIKLIEDRISPGI